ncbi:hypothetical protein QQX98_004091 [Neonectria punicea]|uniref:Nephrocystin 3-like N-terminal domain-containing protein n=1 Tax=Neonectria punicea TaxID=979145 RepID=A0ABR1HAD5_9HYPO
MADKSLAARESNERQACLDFNETRLPEYHEAFANPQVRFNTALGRYAPVPKDGNMGQAVADNQQQLQLLPERSTTPSSNPPRLPFWDEMFPQAMAQLKTIRNEPAGLVRTPNSVRDAAGWPKIVNTLEVARAKYYNYSGFIGFWKKRGHKIADHATDGKTLFSLLPNSEYTSVIHCVFDVIFDAAKRTAEIREEVEGTLRQMREKLSDVERVVALCADDDDHIVPAAMNVLVSVLQALEDIVLYYSAKRGMRMTATVLWKKDEYKADLSECLAGIDSSSKRLIEEANLTHIRVTRLVNMKASEGLEKLKKLQLGQAKVLREQKRLADKQSDMAISGRKIASRQGKLATGLRREAASNERNAIANERNAAANMISATALNGFLRLSEEYFVAKSNLERAQCLNAKLVVKNERLSSALQQERSRSRGRYPLLSPEPISQDQLLQMLNLPDSAEETDVGNISDSAVLVNRRDQGRAEQLISNPQFQRWMVQTRSTELLVHGHMKPSRTSVSALSLFSAAIVQSLRRDQRFCTLAFFCGEHSNARDPLAGGIGIIKSLIVQLLNQYQFDGADLGLATREVDLDVLEDDAEQLCRLFVGLMRRVQSKVTLFCVLDSVNVYDDPEFMQELEVERVLYEVLSLTRDIRVQTHVKILLTSPTDTATIWEGFDERDLVSMAGQPKGDKRFDDSRLAVQLEGVLLG